MRKDRKKWRSAFFLFEWLILYKKGGNLFKEQLRIDQVNNCLLKYDLKNTPFGATRNNYFLLLILAAKDRFTLDLLQSLKEPYPRATFLASMKRNFFFGLFLTVFLVVFTPFGLDVFAYDRVHIILGYGLTSTLMIIINDVTGYYLFPGVFDERNWKVYHQITWGIIHLITLGISNLAFGYAVGAFPLTWISFFKLELYVFACAIIPVTVITLMRQNYLLRKNTLDAQVISTEIKERQTMEFSESAILIKITAENNKDSFEVDANSILWIQSQDNYVEIVLKKGEKYQKELLRSTLTKVEELLSNRPNFLRCHRAYIVNLDQVKSVMGNSQGYRLLIKGTSEEIPVARPKNKVLKDLIHQRATL
jgi:hypothetical protein